MRTLTIDYDEDLAVLSGQTHAQFESEARFLLALKLFEVKRISSGRAAEMAGISKPDFLVRATNLGVPVVDLEDDQLDAEFSAL